MLMVAFIRPDGCGHRAIRAAPDKSFAHSPAGCALCDVSAARDIAGCTAIAAANLSASSRPVGCHLNAALRSKPIRQNEN